MTASVPCGTDQSSRAKPPAAVSPETPALSICGGDPFGGQRGLQPRHEAILRGQAETRRQRIAKRHDLDRRPPHLRRE